MTRAPAKLNLALVVGATRADGKHELVTVFQRLELHDAIELEPAEALRVEGFAGDTLVRDALTALAAAAGVEPRWHARIDKRIPVAGGTQQVHPWMLPGSPSMARRARHRPGSAPIANCLASANARANVQLTRPSGADATARRSSRIKGLMAR